MIEKSQLEPLLDLIQEQENSLEERFKVISALVVLQLNPAAWEAVLTLAESVLNDLVAEGRLTEDKLEILARVPLQSVRARLHQLAEKTTNHLREEITLFPLEQSNNSVEVLAGISIIDTAEVKKLVQKLSRVAWKGSRLNVDSYERPLLKHLSPAETTELLESALAH